VCVCVCVRACVRLCVLCGCVGVWVCQGCVCEGVLCVYPEAVQVYVAQTPTSVTRTCVCVSSTVAAVVRVCKGTQRRTTTPTTPRLPPQAWP
jgi:hypothetical protein